MAVTIYELVGPALMLTRRWTSLAALGRTASFGDVDTALERARGYLVLLH